MLFIHRTWNCGHIGFLKHLTQLGLVSLAFFTALSRVQDNKHHPGDVLFGSLLGIVIAILIYVLLQKFLKKQDYKIVYDLVNEEGLKDSEQSINQGSQNYELNC